MQQLSLILCAKMTEDLDVSETRVITPDGQEADGVIRDQGSIVILPVLRAGLVMAEKFSELMPMARMAHIGVYGDEHEDRHCYMLSLPTIDDETKFIILDVTMSTGKTMLEAVKYLDGLDIEPERIRVGCILTCKPGVKEFHAVHPNIELFYIGMDEALDERGHIDPGLGNPSARLFRTEDDEEMFE